MRNYLKGKKEVKLMPRFVDHQKRVHTDISTKTGERFIIVTLADDLERKVSIRK